MRRLLIIGCGDVALRMVPLVRDRHVIYGLTRDRERMGALRAAGLKPLWGDLDRPATLGALPGLAHDVVHFAPPAEGAHDVVIEQGYEIGRPSRITLSVTVRGRQLAGAGIGGEAVVVTEGTIEA